MSILIKGMEMPKNCMACPMVSGYELKDEEKVLCSTVRCRLTNTKRPNGKSIPDNCPLVPVPPHGDLVDRNKLYEKTAEWEAEALHLVAVHMNDEDISEWRKWSAVLTERSAFKFDVADAPAIIPAEEGET